MEPWLIIAILVHAGICGLLSNDLANKKGYSGIGPFLIGFFLGILGLLYVAGLPLSPAETQRRFAFLHTTALQNPSHPDTHSVSTTRSGYVPKVKPGPAPAKVTCPKCGEMQSAGTHYCVVCGTKLH